VCVTVGARRWSWVLVLVVGLVLFEAVQHAILVTGNPNLVPALIPPSDAAGHRSR
jgi:hypothetical protein